MKSIHYISIVLFFAVFSSCQKVIDMDISSKPPKLVINAWLQPDSLVKVHLSHSIHILDDEEIKIVENGSIILFENNSRVDSLIYIGNGMYSNTSFKPKSGNTYKIEASAPNYPAISAEAFIPDTVSIENIKIENNNDDYLNKSLSFSFKDPGNTNNYYLIYLETETEYPTDTIKYEYNPSSKYLVNFSIDNPIVELSGYGLLDEYYPVDQSGMSFENEKKIYANTIAFSDQAINGQSVQLKLNSNFYNYYEDSSISQKTNLHVVSISKDFFLYIGTITSSNDDPFTERIHVRTNVTNGYGILLSSNKSSRSIHL